MILAPVHSSNGLYESMCGVSSGVAIGVDRDGLALQVPVLLVSGAVAARARGLGLLLVIAARSSGRNASPRPTTEAVNTRPLLKLLIEILHDDVMLPLGVDALTLPLRSTSAASEIHVSVYIGDFQARGVASE